MQAWCREEEVRCAPRLRFSDFLFFSRLTRVESRGDSSEVVCRAEQLKTAKAEGGKEKEMRD